MVSVDVGSTLDNRYRLIERRASGASATVWVADDEFLRRRVAVKILHEHLANDVDLVERFGVEARSAATVSHPALVEVYDSMTTPPAIVLELVDGPDLRGRLDLGVLDPAATAELGAALCAGLAALHDQGLVHRDVKPANILLTHDGDPKLTDFGIATANAGDRTATGVVLGTAKYLAPEQVRGETLDGRCDVFALAVVLYEALVGHPPWVREGDLATALARLNENAVALRQLRPDVSESLDAAIMTGLELQPVKRWPSAAAFGQALLGHEVIDMALPRSDDTTETMTRFVVPDGDSKRSLRVRRRSRFRWRLIVGLAFMISIGALGWTLIVGTDSASDTPGGPTTPEIVSIRTFDPQGSGAPGEHDDLVERAIDGDPSTGWPTERYSSRDFGAKSGVGLILVLDQSAEIDAVEIRTRDSSDWAVDIRVADLSDAELRNADDPDRFGPIVGTGASLEMTPTIPVSAAGRTILVWITDLGAGPVPIRLMVDEVTVR